MEYKRLNLRLSLQMAAPHTWPAAMAPALFSGALVWGKTGKMDLFLWLLLLMICILMQSAANIFNDYFDLLRGTDRPEDNVEINDAVLVHNPIPPRQALILGSLTLGMALLLAVFPVIMGGWRVLAIGLVGAVILLTYSGGPTPLSTLPVGEFAAGITMGGLIPLACTTALTGSFDSVVLIDSLPIILGIALMMMTNNICDIERDIRADRRTFPAGIGRAKARFLYRLLLLLWVVLLAGYMLYRFPVEEVRNKGILILFILILGKAVPTFVRQFKLDLEPPCRPGAMKGIASLNALLALVYILWIVL